jgi:protein TonB
LRVGGRVVAANLISQAPPTYPPAARAANIQGDVVLEADITKEGLVESLRVLSGHPLLVQAAIDAVKQWVYRPILLNGQPVDLLTSITISFEPQN